MVFESAVAKRRANFAKHGIGFETAQRIFGAAVIPQGEALLA